MKSVARPKSPCGTVAAYRRHLRSDERPCSACADANNEDARRRRAERVDRGADQAPPEAPSRSIDSRDAEDVELIRNELRGALQRAPVDKKAPIARVLLEVILRTSSADAPGDENPQEVGEDEFTRARRERSERQAGA